MAPERFVASLEEQFGVETRAFIQPPIAEVAVFAANPAQAQKIFVSVQKVVAEAEGEQGLETRTA